MAIMLHLSPETNTNIFAHDPYEFIRFLNYLESNFERIYLLGDIYDTLMSNKIGGDIDIFYKIIENNKEITNIFLKPNYYHISGNHDLITSDIFNAPEQEILDIDGIKILLTHGHQYGAFTNNLKFVGEFWTWLGGKLLKYGLDDIWQFIYDIDLKSCFRFNKSCPFQKWAIKELINKDAEIIITGHTHTGAVINHGNKLFMNSGTCIDGKYSYLSLDTKLQDFRLNTAW